MSTAMLNTTETAPAGPQPSPVRRWLREPLLHFLLIGLGLFALYRMLNPAAVEQENRSRIELTDDDLRQLELGWMAQWRRPPTPEEMRRLVESKVREEILYREALALGLDQGDTIVKRRMAQKMEFLAEDLSALREPNREELKDWFEKNPQRFTIAGRASFRHLYFSFDRRGEQAREAAEGEPFRSSPTSRRMRLAHRLWPIRSCSRTTTAIARRSRWPMCSGRSSPGALFQLEPGSWQGPIESGFGWHLVWVDSMTPARVPAFEEVEPEVKAEWVAEQRAEFKRRAFEAMKARYEIVLPKAPAKEAPLAVVPPTKGGS